MQGALLLGFALGFVTASPVGPIGLLCLRRTLSRHDATGLISALGISTAYAFWSYVAIHGLASVSHWIAQERNLLQAAIGLFFLLYGLHGIFNGPSASYATLGGRTGISEFLSTFLVVFLNPATFLTFSALFTLFGMAKSDMGLVDSLEVALTVFAGSITFWIGITHVVQRTRSVNDSIFASIAHLSSYAIALFGLGVLLYCLHGYLTA